jgi:hypothetical protein
MFASLSPQRINGSAEVANADAYWIARSSRAIQSWWGGLEANSTEMRALRFHIDRIE